VVPASPYSYNISANGAAGNRYWDVTSDGEVIARGLAATQALARADAMTAARLHGDSRPQMLPAVSKIPPTLSPL
jgi:hypothetical protein